MQDFTLGNKLFIVCEYMPYSLLQLLEGTAAQLDPSSDPTGVGQAPSDPQMTGQPPSRQPCAFFVLLPCVFDLVTKFEIKRKD